MEIVTGKNPKTLMLVFTDDEWSVVKHLNKVFGSTFIKTHIEKFISQRATQRESVRAEKLVKHFNSLPESDKKDIMSKINLSFDDE